MMLICFNMNNCEVAQNYSNTITLIEEFVYKIC